MKLLERLQKLKSEILDPYKTLDRDLSEIKSTIESMMEDRELSPEKEALAIEALAKIEKVQKDTSKMEDFERLKLIAHIILILHEILK